MRRAGPGLLLLLWAAVAAAAPARAAVQLCDRAQFPACLQDYATCEFDLDYGNTGAALYLGALRVEGQGTLTNPQVPAQTDLEIGCAVHGEGTSLLTVTTTFRNAGAGASPDLRFFAFVNPDGNAFSGSAFLYDVAEASVPASAAPGQPSGWGIDELGNLDAGTPGNLEYEIFTAGALADQDYCGGPFCDVVFALQWELGSLGPGEARSVSVGFSDAGVPLSVATLSAARADDVTGLPDDPGTVLTFSGRSHVEPIPALPGAGAALLAVLLPLLARRARS